MKINYILTTFSPAMFGEGAVAAIRMISTKEARGLVTDDTRIVATRVSHERLARSQFPAAGDETARYAQLKPGVNAIHLHYRGPQIPEDGEIPAGAMVTYYLCEVTEHSELV